MSTLQESRTAPRTAEQLDALDWEDLAPARPADLSDVVHGTGFATSEDGVDLFWQTWSAREDDRRGNILLIHGFGEHSARYEHAAVGLVRAGYDVFAYDVRGHGQSEGPRGFVLNFNLYLQDVATMHKVGQKHLGDQEPWFVLGHSNGGLITLQYALRRPEAITGFAVTSPFCAVAMKVPKWKTTAGRLLSRVIPKLGMPADIDPSFVSRDLHVVKAYGEDPLNHGTATARWFTETVAAQADLLERAPMIQHPLLMLVGGSDKIADPEVSQRVYQRVGSSDRELEVYTEMYHEILNELEWTRVLRRLVEWLDQQSADHFRLQDADLEEEE